MVVPSEENVEVVISGIGGYFPRSKNIEELQQLLMDNVECIDDARWKAEQLDVCDKTGNVDQINYFDASYFGIHRQQSVFMDPMCRLALQNTLEAIIDAGVNPVSLRGRRVLVTVASCISENDSLMFENVENGFGVTGQARGMLSNRISYWLNIVGPSYSCDASWLGGIQVLKHGVDAISSGQCESAIVATANLAMNIYPTYLMKLLKFISPDGHTRSFEENADGYIRSDGICVFFLQRADQARRRYASIVNVDLMYNGFRNGQYLCMNPDSARKFLTEFYQYAKVDPSHLDYIESYGSAIPALDKMELQVFQDVFGGKNRKNPLLIGAVKKNIGHSEASCAFGSIVKAIIAMESGTIPSNFTVPEDCDKVNKKTSDNMRLITENTPWDSEYAAVNCFGMSSAYGHVLLRRNTVERSAEASLAAKQLPLLHVFATRSEEGIKEIIDKIKSKEVLDLDYMNLINGVFTTNIPGYLYRGYVVKSADQPSKEEFTHYNGTRRQVWLVYSGMGSQWVKMGYTLMQLPIFARTVQRCAAALQPHGVDLIHILTADDKSLFDNILYSFVGIAAVQVGLTELLRALGMEYDGIIGHSVGELGCAYADGCLTAEQMILAAYYRGRASLEAELIPGLMAAVGIGAEAAQKLCPPSIDIACHNGPDSCTLSGPKADMEVLVEKLQKAEIFARLVNVAEIAYHSRYIKPAAPLLINYMRQLIPNPRERSAKWLSSSVPESRWNTELAQTVSAEYLTNNLLSSVLFEEVVKKIPQDAVLIEIAPHGLLQAILKRSTHPNTVNIALTKRGHSDGLEFLFSGIGKMFLAGIPLNISALYNDIYSGNSIVPRGTPSLAPLVHWSHTERWRTGLEEFKDYSNSEQTFSLDSHENWFRDVLYHRFHNMYLVPGTAYLPLVSKILSNTHRVDAVEFSNVYFHRHRTLASHDEYVPPVRIMVQRGTGLFEVSDRYGIVATGQATVLEKTQHQQLLAKLNTIQEVQMGKEMAHLNEKEIYQELAIKGLDLDGAYRIIMDLHIFKNGVVASIKWKNNWSAFLTALFHIQLLHSNNINSNSIVPGYTRQVAISFEQMPEEGSVLEVRYNSVTKSFWSPIAEMNDSFCIPATINGRGLLANSTRFVPHNLQLNQQQDVTLKSVVQLCMHLVQSHISNDNMHMNVIACKDLSTKPILNIIQELSKENIKQQIYLHLTDSLASSRITNLPTSSLLVVSSQHMKNVAEYIQQYPNTHILFCSDELGVVSNLELVEIINYQGNDAKFLLVKQVCKTTPIIVNGPQNAASIEDLDNSTISWVRDLQSKLRIQNDQRVFLTCRALPLNNLNDFLIAIQQLPNGHKARLIFLLDEKTPICAQEESFYQSVFNQDIMIAIYAHGQWGSCQTTTLQLTDQDLEENDRKLKQQNILSQQSVNAKMNGVDIKYLGVHSSSFILTEDNDESEPIPKLGLADYCGVNKKTNERVMGIMDGTLNPDPIFQWLLPASWTFVDGASAPVSYALTYYILSELADLEAGETVLVHNACSSIGQALINVVHSMGARVLGTVANEHQRAILLNHFRVFNNDSIFDYTSTKFQEQILEVTQGNGVDVLINCFRGKRLHANLNCLTSTSRVILLQNEATLNSNSNETIGLSTFFNCIGMYGVQRSRICKLPLDMKKRIHQLIQNALDNDIITPIRRNIFRHQQPLENIIRYVMGSQATGAAVIPIQNINLCQQSSNTICGTYVVLAGTTTTAECALTTSAWLIRHGARHVRLCAPEDVATKINFLQRRLQLNDSLVRVYKKLPLAAELSSMTAIIVLPGANLPSDGISTGIKQVVCISPGIISPPTLHRNRSTIRWKKESHFNDIIHFLDYALNETTDLIILDQHNTDQIDETSTTFISKDFFRLLANSVPSLSAVQYLKGVDNVSVTQINSSSPQVVYDQSPLFIAPGLLGVKCRYLQHTISRLIGPVYVVETGQPGKNNMEELAIKAVQGIRAVYPSGPYNIAGVSTGGILALEITRQLESTVGSGNVQLYLLDGVPDTLQHLIQESYGNNSNKLDTIILQHFLCDNDLNNDNISSTENQKWSDRINIAMQSTTLSEFEASLLIQALNEFRGRLHQILHCKPNESPLNAIIRLLKPHESSKDFSNSLTNYCKQLRMEIFKGNHFTMLQSYKLAEYINESTIFPQIYT